MNMLLSQAEVSTRRDEGLERGEGRESTILFLILGDYCIRVSF